MRDPVCTRGGAVAAKPAGDLGRVGDLEVDCYAPGEGVNGGDRRCEERVKDDAVDVVDDLYGALVTCLQIYEPNGRDLHINLS